MKPPIPVTATLLFKYEVSLVHTAAMVFFVSLVCSWLRWLPVGREVGDCPALTPPFFPILLEIFNADSGLTAVFSVDKPAGGLNYSGYLDKPGLHSYMKFSNYSIEVS